MLNRDVEKSSRLTRLPFVTRGNLDSDPSTTHDAESFKSIFPSLRQQDVGLSAEPISMLEYVRLTTAPSAEGEQARVGEFRFERIEGRWRFVLAYLDQ